jgi:hypothetical protein
MVQQFQIGDRTFRITSHALGRALDMGIDGALIRAAIEKPKSVGFSHRYGTTLYDRKDITVAVAEGPVNHIITILWRNDKKWRKDLSRGEYAGRTLRAPRGGAVV